MSGPPAAFLLIDVAGTTCALPRDDACEILPLPHLHHPPASGGPLAGFADFGGRALPVVDLAALLGLRERSPEPDPYRHLVLARDGSLALLVDRVLDVIGVEAEAIGSVDDELTLNGCVVAEIARRGGLVHVLSLARLLLAEERARVDALAARAEARLSTLDSAIVPG